MIRPLRFPMALLAVLMLSHCGAPQPPRCVRLPASARAQADVSVHLGEARTAWAALANPAKRSAWPAAQERYNAALRVLFDSLRCGSGGGCWAERAAAMDTTLAPEDGGAMDPEKLEDVFSASLVKIKKLDQRRVTDGVGLPLVGWTPTSPVGVPRGNNALPTGAPFILTATLDFSGPGRPLWTFHNRWSHDEIRIGGATHSLAADWTAPNEFFWQMSDLADFGLRNLVLPSRFSRETGLYFLHPYDPGRIPLVMVHGLASSPDAFKESINALIPEPWFRENYQIWLFCYPTGYPWPYNAASFRTSLAAACADARAKGPAHNLERMVVIGHSMGGLITRGSLTEPRSDLFRARYGAAPDGKVSGSIAHREMVREMFLYKPPTEPKRAIFLATPHRGSPVADLRVSTWVSRLIHLPKTLTIDLLDSTLQAVGDLATGGPSNLNAFRGTSIGTLSPANPVTRALGSRPLPDIPCHSVIGDRGKGDAPQGSDGIVPYWSSHVDQAVSEKIVPSGHSVQVHPETNEEIKRILLLHLRENGRAVKSRPHPITHRP